MFHDARSESSYPFGHLGAWINKVLASNDGRSASCNTHTSQSATNLNGDPTSE